MKFTLSATKQEAKDTFSFIFAPEQPLQWKAGQLLRYVLDHPNPDDRGVERFFSIASAPHEKEVMLTTGAEARIMVRRCSNVHIDTKNTKYLWVDFVVHRCRDAVY
jgi:ferredoxin-NADP reductase